MASSSSSSTSSRSSSPSSRASSPSSPGSVARLVASGVEIRFIVRKTASHVPLRFNLDPQTSLSEAHLLWGLLSEDEGGHGELMNPDLLGKKEEALRFLNTKLDDLKAWKGKVDAKLDKVLAEVGRLQTVILDNGPGARAGFEVHCYGGGPVVIDTDQDVADEDLDSHIARIQALFLQASPVSPAEGDNGTLTECRDLEVSEQRDVTQFNLEYLQLKARALQLLSNEIGTGVTALEDRFVREPSYLGASSADFVRFVEIDM